MKAMTTGGQPRDGLGSTRRARSAAASKPRRSKRAAADLAWPGSGADPYLLQRHAELPAGGSAAPMGWPYD